MKSRPKRTPILIIAVLGVVAAGWSWRYRDTNTSALATARSAFLIGDALWAIASELTPEMVSVYEDQLRENPDNLELHYRLACYYSTSAFDDGPWPEIIPHVLWIIRNHPDAPFAGEFWVQWDEGSFSGARELWLKNIELNRDDPTVLGNAGQFFVRCALGRRESEDLDRAEALLARALRLEPTNPKWSYSLGLFYMMEYYYMKQRGELPPLPPDAPPRPLQADARAPDSDGRAELAAKALANYERALRHWRGRLPSELVLKQLILNAMRAGDLEKADRYAREFVDRSVEEVISIPDSFSNTNFFGNLVIAHVALEKGDLAAAEAHMFRLPAVMQSWPLVMSGPMNLASELLKRDRKAAVLEYLHRCEKVYKYDKIAEWICQIESGETPEFNTEPWY